MIERASRKIEEQQKQYDILQDNLTQIRYYMKKVSQLYSSFYKEKDESSNPSDTSQPKLEKEEDLFDNNKIVEFANISSNRNITVEKAYDQEKQIERRAAMLEQIEADAYCLNELVKDISLEICKHEERFLELNKKLTIDDKELQQFEERLEVQLKNCGGKKSKSEKCEVIKDE